MAKHNNALQREHLRKNWQPLVKTFFNQPAQKKRRLLKRREKAAVVTPRPLKSLRSVVRKCTQRYSSQTRLGRGFSIQEVKKAGLSLQFAKSIGICIDHRRNNKSVETFQNNVDRLKSYLEKLVLLPKSKDQPKKGNQGVLSDSTDKVDLVQNVNNEVLGDGRVKLREKPTKVTPQMNTFRAHSQLRIERMNKKWAGKRAKRENNAEN
jgi:large subunit ribosomal protein L13e